MTDTTGPLITWRMLPLQRGGSLIGTSEASDRRYHLYQREDGRFVTIRMRKLAQTINGIEHVGDMVVGEDVYESMSHALFACEFFEITGMSLK